MNAALYSNLYNVLRRHAKDWDIDYTRYTHAQLRYAFELNKGVVDASLRKRLLGMPPINAYHAAVSSGKTEKHDVLRGGAIQNAERLCRISNRPPMLHINEYPPVDTPVFALPAPQRSLSLDVCFRLAAFPDLAIKNIIE